MEKHYFNFPYDLSGSRAKNRFRNEMLWGLEKIFELYKANKDFIMVFDYVCDVETHVDGKFEFYQVKTNSGANPYTITKIAKADKTGNSILGKLYKIKSVDGDVGTVSKLAIVVNVPLKTIDNKTYSSEKEISFEAIDKGSIKKIEEYLKAECNIDRIDLKDCYYIYTSMDLFNPHESLLGKTVNFFVDIYGEEPRRAKVLFQTLVDTIEIKANYELKCDSYKELVCKKGITRDDFQKIIKKSIDITDESIIDIRREIDAIYPEFSLKTKMNTAVVTLIRDLKTSKVLQKIEKEIVQYIYDNLEEFNVNTVDAISLLDGIYSYKFPTEYGMYTRHALYIMLIVRIREGYYA